MKEKKEKEGEKTRDFRVAFLGSGVASVRRDITNSLITGLRRPGP